ncbi:MAG: hypothetical protein JXA66_08620 [Oligoflexia bacterium]|nr:hypothetical protein [Oligoflexia bacterium]
MCTGYSNDVESRIALLIRSGEVIFHTRDLAILWNINISNTLYTTIKRYCQKKILFRVHKGMYSVMPLEKLDPLLLGLKVLHKYSYVSTETVLFNEGLISQPSPYITLVSDKSYSFRAYKHLYRCRQLRDEFLFQDAGILKRNGIMIATPERAVADLLYFNPKAVIDGYKIIDWKKVNRLGREIGYNADRQQG